MKTKQPLPQSFVDAGIVVNQSQMVKQGRFGHSSSGHMGNDPAPQVRRAGLYREVYEGGIFPHFETKDTPEKLRPFHQAWNKEIGRTASHWGTRNDEPLDENTRFGKVWKSTGSVEECLKPQHADKMGALAEENAQKRYLSSIREPLGKGPAPSYPLPEKILRSGFGAPSHHSEPVQQIIYSCPDIDHKELYPVGVTVDRNYQWDNANIDPTTHRFGQFERRKDPTTRELLAPCDPPTTFQTGMAADFQAMRTPDLGKTKWRGSGRSSDPAFVYGKPNTPDEATVKDLITSHGSQDDCEYERSLGKASCTSYIMRKQRELDSATREAAQGEGACAASDHIFGLPSIRHDLERPSYRKVTNGKNYGDEVGAGGLIYPNGYVSRGIDEMYVTAPLCHDQLKQFIKESGLNIKEEDIERVFNAKQKDGFVNPEVLKEACLELGV